MKNFIKNFNQFQRLNEQEDLEYSRGESLDGVIGQLEDISQGCGAKIFKPGDDEVMLYVPQPTRNDEYANRWVVRLFPGNSGWTVTTEHSEDGEMGVRGSENFLVQDVDASEAIAAIADWCENA